MIVAVPYYTALSQKKKSNMLGQFFLSTSRTLVFFITVLYLENGVFFGGHFWVFVIIIIKYILCVRHYTR